MTPQEQAGQPASRGCLGVVLSILMLLVGLVLLAPGLLCFVMELREPSPENVIKSLLFGVAAIGLLLVFFAIRRMMPRRHG